MQLPSACCFFVFQFLLKFRSKVIDFCMLFDAITFGVWIFSCFNLCFNFHQKYMIFARFLMQLPSACPFFRACIYASHSTKNHRFFARFLMQLPSACRFFSTFNLCSNFEQKSSIFACRLMDDRVAAVQGLSEALRS